MADAAITVVIPTLAQRERAAGLFRAVDSVVRQAGVRALPLVVVNGPWRDAELVRALLADRRLRVVQRDDAGLPEALRLGAEHVDTPWWGTLDDDDLLLDGALPLRHRALAADDGCDVVATNGYRHAGGRNVLHVAAGAEVAADPLRALLRGNWLLPGSWLARADRVDAALFDGMPHYLECTYLAARFATRYRLRWLDEPTVVYHAESPLAASRSRAYTLAQPDALRAMLTLDLPDDVRQALRTRVAGACHTAADGELRRGHTREAWRWHAETLREPGGWRHLTFVRHLLRASLRPGAGTR